jgi:hypothetical protein
VTHQRLGIVERFDQRLYGRGLIRFGKCLDRLLTKHPMGRLRQHLDRGLRPA